MSCFVIWDDYYWGLVEMGRNVSLHHSQKYLHPIPVETHSRTFSLAPEIRVET
jgi:hypothetical protein